MTAPYGGRRTGRGARLLRPPEVLAMLDQLGAERAHGVVLLDRIAPRHVDHGRNAMAAGREAQALPVVAARGGDDPGRIGALALQPVKIDQPAPHLEGADRRVVLLDHDRGTQPLRQQRPGNAGVGGTACPTIWCARSSSARSNTSLPSCVLVIPAKAGIQYSRDAREKPSRRGVLDRPVKPCDDSGIGVQHQHPHTSALPPAKAAAVASSVASTGRSISLCALPDELSGNSFRSAANCNRTAPDA